MKPFNRVNEADLAFFESILPGAGIQRRGDLHRL